MSSEAETSEKSSSEFSEAENCDLSSSEPSDIVSSDFSSENGGSEEVHEEDESSELTTSDTSASESEEQPAPVKRSKIDETAATPVETYTPPAMPKMVFGSAAKNIVSFTSLSGASTLPVKNLFAQTASAPVQETESEPSTKKEDSIYEVVTGEENEDTLITIKGKLFEFNSTSKDWVEKGAGTVKLNMDAKNKKYRILMRTDTVQKLVLNSSIFAEMTCEVVQPKNLRFSAYSLDAKIQTYLLRTKTAEEAESLEQQVKRVLDVLKDC